LKQEALVLLDQSYLYPPSVWRIFDAVTDQVGDSLSKLRLAAEDHDWRLIIAERQCERLTLQFSRRALPGYDCRDQIAEVERFPRRLPLALDAFERQQIFDQGTHHAGRMAVRFDIDLKFLGERAAQVVDDQIEVAHDVAERIPQVMRRHPDHLGL